MTRDGDYEVQHRLLDRLVSGDLRSEAERNVVRYFREPEANASGFAGRRFESFGGPTPLNEVTEADVLALSLLRIERGLGDYAIAVLGERRTQITELLSDIPDIALHQTSADMIARGSKAWQLWDLLARATGGYRWVTAYKLMARKRPTLFPVFDRTVARVIGADGPEFDYWHCLWCWFDDRPSRLAEAQELHSSVTANGHSLLRCLDVAL